MIALLDPMVFIGRSNQQIEEDLRTLLLLCRIGHVDIPAMDEYWPALWGEVIRPIEQKADFGLRQVLHELRKLASKSIIPGKVDEAAQVKVWRKGFTQMFPSPNDSWEDMVVRAAARLVLQDRQVVILTSRIVGRNIKLHASGDCVIHECTRWVLYLQVTGAAHRSIFCLTHIRNLTDFWTIRYDPRLPGEGTRYPFRCPVNWIKGSVVAVATNSSKPCWIDAAENGWSRPNIPGGAGYHWDVFVKNARLIAALGVNQVNIVEYGAPVSEGEQGTIHHIPKEKLSRLKDVGW